jgi:WD40 repeat protein
MLGSQHQTVRLWDVASGHEVLRGGAGHQATVCSVAFTPDGSGVVSSSWEGAIRVWDAATGAERLVGRHD